MTLSEIYNNAGLNQFEIDMTESYVEEDMDGCFIDTPAFEKLFEYFAFEACEMPYGVAKARTGCPDEWILDYLQELK